MRKNRSDAVYIMMCCNALAMHKIEINLITPKIERLEYQIEFSKIFSLYGLKQSFSIIELPTKLIENLLGSISPLKMILQKLYHFNNFYFKNRKTLSENGTLIYAQCYISTLPYIILKKLGLISSKLVFTVSAVKKKSFLHKYILRNSDLIVAPQKYTSIDILKYTGVAKEKLSDIPLMFLSHLKEEENILDKQKCRLELGFENNKNYITYAGKTGKILKSVDYFIECAERLPQFNFVIVGTNETSKAYYNNVIEEKGLKNLIIISFLSLPEYTKYVNASDLLVDYYESTYFNKYYLGPGKSATYFNSKNPVLFSDLPSLRNLYPEDIVYFVKPDNSNLLAKKMEKIFANQEEMNEKANRAYQFSQKYTYEYTMGKILEVCQKKLYEYS